MNRPTSPCFEISIRDRRFKQEKTPERNDEELDPRIKVELDRLNDATNDINIMEKQLDEARATFRQMLHDSTRSLKFLMNKLGQSIDKARPYFEAQSQALKAQQECQQAANRYEKACESHQYARDAIAIAEEKISQNDTSFDAAWQEMLNHANLKVLEAEQDKENSESEHHEAATAFTQLKTRALQLEKSLKKCVNKTRPYFEERASHLKNLESQKAVVIGLEESYKQAKSIYAAALCNLETISEEIHEKRQDILIGGREEGVGAEADITSSVDTVRPLVRGESIPKNKEVIREKRPIDRNMLRTSLCMDLGVDFDIGDICDAEPQSPSSKSVDLGALQRRNTDEFEILDINRLQDMLQMEPLPLVLRKESTSQQKH